MSRKPPTTSGSSGSSKPNNSGRQPGNDPAAARPRVSRERVPTSDGPERLHKVLANAGVASRRDCEQIIREGRVRVNGELIQQLPAWADLQQDRIEVDGKPLSKPRRGKGSDRVYIALHKPKRVISTTDDPQGRRQVTDLVDLPPNRSRRLYPVGRLDADSTGLILLTNDGELANRLSHPRYGVSKRYHVTVRGRCEESDLQRLRKGLMLTQSEGDSSGDESGEAATADGPRSEGPKVRRASMSFVKLLGYEKDPGGGARTNLAVELKEGQNREIRRLMARLGFKVKRLKRVSIGPLSIKGIGIGQWRALSSDEVRRLQRATGLRGRLSGKTGQASQAGGDASKV